jgi:hypothetical protein
MTLNARESLDFLDAYRRAANGIFVYDRVGTVPSWIITATTDGLIRNTHIEGNGDSVRIYQITRKGRHAGGDIARNEIFVTYEAEREAA